MVEAAEAVEDAAVVVTETTAESADYMDAAAALVKESEALVVEAEVAIEAE